MKLISVVLSRYVFVAVLFSSLLGMNSFAVTPVVSQVEIIDDSPFTNGQSVEADYYFQDDDLDDDRSILRWYSSPSALGTSASIISGETTTTLSSVSGLEGRYICFEVTARDNHSPTAETGNTLKSDWELVNTPPVAVVNNYSGVLEGPGNPFVINAPGPLANDEDDDGHTLAINSFTLPHFGTVSLSSNGALTYTHNGSENFRDSITYNITDNYEISNTTWIKFNITPTNESPIADNESYTFDEGDAVIIVEAQGVLIGDTDPDDDDLEAILVDDVSYGTLALNSDGSFTYEHDGNSDVLSDEFTYRASDGLLLSLPATVSINITPVNDLPILANIEADPLVYSEGDLPTEITTSLTVNDEDNAFMTSATVTIIDNFIADEDKLALPSIPGVTSSYNSSTGRLSITGTRTNLTYRNILRAVTYQNINDIDADGSNRTIEFVINDGEDDSEPITRIIDVTTNNNPPEATGETFDIDEGDTLMVKAEGGLLDNDLDPEGLDITLQYTLLPKHSLSFELDNAGAFTYIHDGSETELDSFKYRVFDGEEYSEQVAVLINITTENDKPEATDDLYELDEGDLLEVTVTSGVRANDSDEETDKADLIITLLEDFDVEFGELTLYANGSFTYQHDSTENFTDRFSYTVSDEEDLLDTAEVILTINEINDPPLLENLGEDTLTFIEDDLFKVVAPLVDLIDEDNNDLISATIEITQNHEPLEDSLYIYQGNALSMSITFSKTNGILTITGIDSYTEYQKAINRLRYKNTNDENPSEEIRRITITASDEDDTSDELDIHIEIEGVNDAPIAGDVEISGVDYYIGEELSGEYEFIDPDEDLEGESVYKWFRADDDEGDGKELLLPDETTYTPVFEDGGKYLAFQVSPMDENEEFGEDSISIWNYIDAAPVFKNLSLQNRINPGAFAVDETVSVKYEYSDFEGDEEGEHIFEWYTSETASWEDATVINGETLDSIEIVEDYSELYLGAKIVPIALDGSTPGKRDSSSLFFISELPSATLSGVDTICNNGKNGILKVTLTGNEPWDFSYSINGGPAIEVNGVTIEENPYELEVSTLGEYELLTVSDNLNSIGNVSGKGSIWYFKNPSAIVDGTISICEGDESDYSFDVNLTGKAPWRIYYSIDNANPDTILNITESPYSIDVSNELLGNYRIDSVIDNNKCLAKGIGTVVVQEKSTPVASIAGNSFLCNGDSTTFEVNINGIAPWTLKYEINGDEQDSLIITTVPYHLKAKKEGEYQLTYVKDANEVGCATGDAAEMQYYEVPTANISGKDSICEGSEKTIQVELAGTAPWTFAYSYQGETVDTILNKYTNPYDLIISREGTYSIDTVIDANGCPGLTAGEFYLDTITAPKITFSNLKDTYNKETLDLVYFNITPFGGKIEPVDPLYTLAIGLSDSTFMFYAVNKDANKHQIVYTYEDALTTCMSSDTVTITVIDSTGTIFPREERVYCFNEDKFDVEASYFGDEIVGFEFYDTDDETKISPENRIRIAQDDRGNIITVDPSEMSTGKKLCVFSYIPDNNNPNNIVTISKIFEFENFESDFGWNSDCFLEGDSITFLPLTLGVEYDSIGWKFPFSDDIFYQDTINAAFPAKNKYDIQHFVTTKNNCSDSLIKSIDLKSTINLGLGHYEEDFENEKSDWITPELLSPNSWVVNDAADFARPSQDGPKAWYTNIADRNNVEQSYVLSPCFDFSSIERPMIKMQIYRAFESGNDGAVIQYDLDNSDKWNRLGSTGSGKQWYDNDNIKGVPAGEKTGWSTDLDPQDRQWVEARHILDELKGEKNVRFRVVYGSDGKADNNLGFAFDDVWIGERNRTLLVEHFTNASDTNQNSIIASGQINSHANKFSNDIIDIQYHTSFPGDDLFYKQSELSVNSTLLLYGIEQVPYTIIDGGRNSMNEYSYDWTSIEKGEYYGIKDIQIDILKDAPFEIDLKSKYNGTEIEIEASIKALQDFAGEVSLKLAIIENQINKKAGSIKEDIFESVLKDLIVEQNAIFNKTWIVGEESTAVEAKWELEDVYNGAELRVVAFIQDEATKEVYQAAISDPEAPLGIRDIMGSNIASLNIYPNPVRDKTFVKLSDYTLKNATLAILSNTGQLVYENKLQDYQNSATLDFSGYTDGFYVVQLMNDGELIGTEKVILIKE